MCGIEVCISASEIYSIVIFVMPFWTHNQAHFSMSSHIDSMRVLTLLLLPITIFPSPYCANVVERQMLAKESTNSEVYPLVGIATLSKSGIPTHWSVQPTTARNDSFATSKNATGGLRLQTFEGSLRGSGAAEPTGPAFFEAHADLNSTLSSSRATNNRCSGSYGLTKGGIVSSYTSQDSQTIPSQTSSTVGKDAILANITSTLASTLPSATLSTSSYSATILGNGSFATKLKSLSEWPPGSSRSHTEALVTSVSGTNGKITTSQRVSWSSQVQSRAGATASTAAATENKGLLATTASTKATATSIHTPSSGFTSTETSVRSWPATITFCSLSDGVAIVGFGYVTTLADGKSSITNTSPSQSLISASPDPGCAGEVAVSLDGLVTTIQLSTLPSATSFPKDGAQVEIQSGTVVQYIRGTLSGFNNAQPIEISTKFVEVINRHTTTQGGWWLIGDYGHIEIPKNRPWNTGKGIGCVGGPALCNMPCGVVDIGLDLFVLINHDDCTSDETGPPGYPGGAVLGIDLSPDPPYPQDVQSSDDGEKTRDPKKKTVTNKEEPTTTSKDSTITSRLIASSSTVSSASDISSSSASAIEYMIVATVGADQTNIQQILREFDPNRGGSYKPDVGDTSISGGTWVYYKLNPYEAGQLSSRSDILAVVRCATVSMFGPRSSPPGPPQTVDSTVSLVTLTPSSSATLLASVIPKHRRSDVGPRIGSGVLRDPGQTKTNVQNDLQKRDPGTRLVRQKRTLNTYPEDLAAISWAPGVSWTAHGDYIFEETKGENTWVYLVDTGVAYRHWVCVRECDFKFETILRH